MANSNWSDNHRGDLGGQEYIQVYNKVNVPYPSGSVPYPVSTEFTVPIMSRAYAVLVNLKEDNKVKVDFSIVKEVVYESTVEPYGTRVWEIAESDPQNVKRGLDINLDGAAEQGITLGDIRNGTVMHVTAQKPVMLLLKYNRDEPYDAMAIDLIPGVMPPSPRGMITPETGIVTVASMMMAVDCVFVIGGRKSFVDMF